MNKLPFIAASFFLSAACGSDDAGRSDIDFFNAEPSAMLGAEGNESTCATCHGTTADATGFSGDSMADIAYRKTFKGGDAPTLLDATNACVTGWMGGTALAETDESWINLEAYLQSISNPNITTPNTLEPEVLADEAAYEAAYAGGNAADGAAKYAAACAICHDESLQLGSVSSPSKALIKGRTIGVIARKVRTSGPPPSGMMDETDLTPGPMPFYEPNELSVQDLKDIIAHLQE